MINLLLKHKQIIKYLIAGGTAALVDLGLLYFFTNFLGIWYLISACLAFVAAFFVSFSLQKFWTFRDGDKEVMFKQMRIYLAVALANFALNAGLMFILVDGFKIWYMFAQLMASGLIACESYLIYKFVIFNKNKLKDGETNFRDSAGLGARVKVLIATGIYPPDIGGPATMLEALVDSLSRLGFAIQIITYADRTEPGQVYRISRAQNKLARYFKYFWQLWLLSRRADILYVTDTYSVGYFAYLIKKITGKRYIVRFAGDSAWEAAVASGATEDYIIDFQEKKYDARIEKLKNRQKKIMACADKVIAVSNFMSAIAEKIGVKKENIRVIYNSIDFLSEIEDSDEIAGIKERWDGAKIIMTACRLTPWKGVAGIIKILPEVKSKLGKIKFVVLGEGGELSKLKQLAEKLGVSGEVEFLGKIEHGHILNYYKAADLFILNTNYEGLSHTLLEVMKAGVPIITTEVGGNPEVITDGREGILVGFDQSEELSAAICKIFGDENLARDFINRAKGKLMVFNWEKTVEQTAKVLKEVI